mgnify:CR=1 FL=1
MFDNRNYIELPPPVDGDESTLYHKGTWKKVTIWKVKSTSNGNEEVEEEQQHHNHVIFKFVGTNDVEGLDFNYSTRGMTHLITNNRTNGMVTIKYQKPRLIYETKTLYVRKAFKIDDSDEDDDEDEEEDEEDEEEEQEENDDEEEIDDYSSNSVAIFRFKDFDKIVTNMGLEIFDDEDKVYRAATLWSKKNDPLRHVLHITGTDNYEGLTGPKYHWDGTKLTDKDGDEILHQFNAQLAQQQQQQQPDQPVLLTPPSSPQPAHEQLAVSSPSSAVENVSLTSAEKEKRALLAAQWNHNCVCGQHPCTKMVVQCCGCHKYVHPECFGWTIHNDALTLGGGGKGEGNGQHQETYYINTFHQHHLVSSHDMESSFYCPFDDCSRSQAIAIEHTFAEERPSMVTLERLGGSITGGLYVTCIDVFSSLFGVLRPFDQILSVAVHGGGGGGGGGGSTESTVLYTDVPRMKREIEHRSSGGREKKTIQIRRWTKMGPNRQQEDEQREQAWFVVPPDASTCTVMMRQIHTLNTSTTTNPEESKHNEGLDIYHEKENKNGMFQVMAFKEKDPLLAAVARVMLEFACPIGEDASDH